MEELEKMCDEKSKAIVDLLKDLPIFVADEILRRVTFGLRCQ